MIALAQITGEIRGVVLDASGAAVTTAKVTAKSLETGFIRTQGSTTEGLFNFPLLPIGNYEVRAEESGFRASVTQALVKTGEIASLQFRLEVGAVTETVTVTDVVSQLDTENAQMQTAVIGANIQEIPVGRNPNLFALTAPGVAPVSANNPFLGSGSFNSNGGRGRGNNIVVDGITSTDVSTTGGSGLGALNFSAIKEVKVITNNFNAEYGRNSSSQLLYLTKNGTNELRGELYEYFQNDKLNARDFFDKSGKAAISRRNYYGFEAGGPLYIPGVIDRRNKVFWHTAYEGQKVRGAGAARIARVPTPAMVAAVADSTSKALISSLQLPSDSSGQLQTSSPNTTDAYQFSVRADANLGTKDTIWGRYSRYVSTAASSALTFILSNLPLYGATSKDLPQQATLQEVHLFSPTMVNEFRFGFGRSSPDFPIAHPEVLGPQITMQNAEVDVFGVWSGLPQGRSQNTYQFTDNLSFSRGRHNLKTGFEYIYLESDGIFDSAIRPVLAFSSWTDFANGRPATYTQRFGNSVRANRVNNLFGFFQDDWKVNPNLTLNLGLRWEWAGGMTEANNLTTNLNPNNQTAYGAAGAGPLGLLETGKPLWTSNNNWGPRVGFAWNIGGGRKTVLRGGYGITYDFLFLNPVANSRFLPPLMYTGSLTGQASFTGGNSLANIIAGTATIQSETKAQVGTLSTTTLNFGNANPTLDESVRNPQVHQWNLGLQRDVAGFVLKATYVGTKGNYLLRNRDINPIAQPVAAATSVADETARLAVFQAANAGLSGSVTRRSNRYDGRYNVVVLADSSANSNYHGGQFEAHRRFAGGQMLNANYTIAKSIDDGSDVLGVLINDSSNQQNPFNNRDNRGPSQFDLRQRLVLTHAWEMPFFKDSSSRVTRALLSGWAFAGISSLRSGFPVTLDAGVRRGLSPLTVLGAGSAIRPNAAGPLEVNWRPAGSAGAPLGTTNPDGVQAISAYANSLGLSQPLLGNFGGLGRNVLRLNGEVNFDWNIYKNFRVWERAMFQLRAEGYNMFNNTSFQDVNRNISNTAFGQYTTVGQNARVFRLGARFIF